MHVAATHLKDTNMFKVKSLVILSRRNKQRTRMLTVIFATKWQSHWHAPLSAHWPTLPGLTCTLTATQITSLILKLFRLPKNKRAQQSSQKLSNARVRFCQCRGKSRSFKNNWTKLRTRLPLLLLSTWQLPQVNKLVPHTREYIILRRRWQFLNRASAVKRSSRWKETSPQLLRKQLPTKSMLKSPKPKLCTCQPKLQIRLRKSLRSLSVYWSDLWYALQLWD